MTYQGLTGSIPPWTKERRLAASEIADQVAKSRWLRIQCVNHVFALTLTIDHPIFDPEANRKVLLDHLFLISAGEITRVARMWLVEQLDAGHRRHIIFMDRDEFLDRLRTGGPPVAETFYEMSEM
jgi:hypothetical protein